jgi:hypothetical protein
MHAIRSERVKSRARNLHGRTARAARKQTDAMEHQHDAEERGTPTSVSDRGVAAQICGCQRWLCASLSGTRETPGLAD